ncbi:hypothetical protein PG997_013130 [Apiospora hydei]|uniref:Protection of telomeres protein 1 n=1 Tax=Apiospora hydei TaxID=1337664 RepID=A0ABR1V5C3_9PEZI
MAGRESTSPASRSVLANRPLPPTFISIQDALNGDLAAKGSLVNIIGVVRDVRPPIPTRNADWKCTMTMVDKSTEDENTGINFSVFRPERSCRIRVTWMSCSSSSAIPMPPKPANDALKSHTGPKAKQPGDEEQEYVSWLYHAVNKDTLPGANEFEEQANRSLNIREKFSLLKDVGDGGFSDLIVQVIKDPHDLVDKVSMWVTDYTENKYFFNHSWDTSNADAGRDGDPYGYTLAFQNPTTRGWPGPFGKRCLQLSCWEPHAGHLRSQVKAGDWIRMRNLQIKYGRNGGNLEGFLREDKAHPSRLGFEVLEPSEGADPRLKEAIRRKVEYGKKFKQQKEALAGSKDLKPVGAKRKGKGEAVTLNSKQRRKLQRAQNEQKVEKQQAQKAELLGLNKQVTCESEDQPVSPLDRILDGVSWKRSGINGEEHVALPFTNVKFRANVRVVDFRPRRLEDFAAGRKVTDFAGPKSWEWRFALELEDASPRAKGEKPERIWALVDNYEAQQLTNMDAVNLHQDPDQLSQLREQLFKLWGNLEECKRPEYDAHLESIRRANALDPPPDSSDNEGVQDGPNQLNGHRLTTKVSNKPFTCCLQQYGLEIPESDPMKCDAGEGKRYQRAFKLFGTRLIIPARLEFVHIPHAIPAHPLDVLAAPDRRREASRSHSPSSCIRLRARGDAGAAQLPPELERFAQGLALAPAVHPARLLRGRREADAVHAAQRLPLGGAVARRPAEQERPQVLPRAARDVVGPARRRQEVPAPRVLRPRPAAHRGPAHGELGAARAGQNLGHLHLLLLLGRLLPFWLEEDVAEAEVCEERVPHVWLFFLHALLGRPGRVDPVGTRVEPARSQVGITVPARIFHLQRIVAAADLRLGVPGIVLGVHEDGDVGKVVVEVVQVGQIHEGLAALVEHGRAVGRIGRVRHIADDPQVGGAGDAETARICRPRDVVLGARREHYVHRDVAVAQRLGNAALPRRRRGGKGDGGNTITRGSSRTNAGC